MLGKFEGRKRRGMTEDEMVRWYHRFNGHEFERILRDSEGQGSLECCSPWGQKELDTTEQLNDNKFLLCHYKNIAFIKSFENVEYNFQIPCSAMDLRYKLLNIFFFPQKHYK